MAIKADVLPAPVISVYEVCLDAAKLRSMARSLRRLFEYQCSDERFGDHEEKRIEVLKKASVNLLEKYGLSCTINADPRGYSIYIHFPDKSSNTWGGAETGWGI